MQCPICKGMGCLDFPEVPSGRVDKCLHCEGKGKILLDSIWKGKLRRFNVVAIYSGLGWVILCGKKFIIEEDFEPTCRLKEVE